MSMRVPRPLLTNDSRAYPPTPPRPTIKTVVDFIIIIFPD